MSDNIMCPNCKEEIPECACMRNKCIQCGNPVGNITFTVCDKCWVTHKPEALHSLEQRVISQQEEIEALRAKNKIMFSGLAGAMLSTNGVGLSCKQKLENITSICKKAIEQTAPHKYYFLTPTQPGK